MPQIADLKKTDQSCLDGISRIEDQNIVNNSPVKSASGKKASLFGNGDGPNDSGGGGEKKESSTPKKIAQKNAKKSIQAIAQ